MIEPRTRLSLLNLNELRRNFKCEDNSNNIKSSKGVKDILWRVQFFCKEQMSVHRAKSTYCISVPLVCSSQSCRRIAFYETKWCHAWFVQLVFNNTCYLDSFPIAFHVAAYLAMQYIIIFYKLNRVGRWKNLMNLR